jgi:hypothetical protein
MFLSLEEHQPWNDFAIMGPVMTELMPPLLQNHFIFADLRSGPEI